MLRKIIWDLLNPRYPMIHPVHRFLMCKCLRAHGIIFMLHRVYHYEKGQLAPNEKLKVSPEYLEQTIINYKNEGFLFISLDDLARCLLTKQFPKSPFIVMTLDDGYRDNFVNAFPIFIRHNVPFTIYITPGFIDHTVPLWWHLLEDVLISRQQQVQLSTGELLGCETREQKEVAFMRIREQILKDPNVDPMSILYQLFENIDEVQASNDCHLLLNWEQIAELSRHQLCTIGGHTMTHPPCSQLSEERFREEVCGSIQTIEAHIKKRVEHFAYPFGTKNEVGKREFELIRVFGFKTVTRVGGGVLTSWNSHSTTALPRVHLA